MNRLIQTLLWFVLIHNFNLFGQPIDLKKELSYIKPGPVDTNHVNACIRLIKYYENKNNDSAIYFAKKAEKVLQEYKKTYRLTQYYPQAKINFALALSGIYKSTAEYNKAISILLDCETIALKNKLESRLDEIYNNTGIIYRNAGYNSKAITYYEQALNRSLKEKDSIRIAEAYINLAVVFRSEKNYQKALEYNRKALPICNNKNLDEYICQLYNNMGVVYKHLENFDSALICYHKSLVNFESSGSNEQIAMSLNNIGSIYRLKKDFQKAESNFLKSLEISRKFGFSKKELDALSRLTLNYFEWNKLEKSMAYADTTIRKASSKNLHEPWLEAIKVKRKILENKNKYSEAIEILKIENALNDSITKKETEEEILKRQFAIELKNKLTNDSLALIKNIKTNKEQTKIKSLQSVISYLTFTCIFLGLIILAYLIRSRLMKKSK